MDSWIDITYQWEGISTSGEKINGFINAPDIMQARNKLRKQGIITRRIAKKYVLFNYHQKITFKDIQLFTKQLATLIESGVPLIQTFDILASSQTKLPMRSLLRTIKNKIETGLTMTESFGQHPKFFNSLFCNMILIGEQSGTLDLMLNKIALHQDKMSTLKQKIINGLTYPIAVVLIGLLVTGLFMMFIIPQFELFFINFNAEIPWITRCVLNLSNSLKSQWLIILSSIVSLSLSFIHAYKRKPKFTHWVQLFLFKMPILGKILRHALITRFADTLSVTLSAGLGLSDALTLVSDVTSNFQYIAAINRIKQSILQGTSLHLALHNTHLFPNLVVQMISIGEESGRLEFMLNKMCDYYEDEVNQVIERMSHLFEPVIMSVLGLLVGGLIMAIYLPILNLGSII